MYTGDKSHRITLRVNDEQFEFVKSSADVLGVSPSDFLRMVVNLAMSSSQNVPDDIVQDVTTKVLQEGLRRENEKTNIDNKL